jgi:hypothetical protein
MMILKKRKVFFSIVPNTGRKLVALTVSMLACYFVAAQPPGKNYQLLYEENFKGNHLNEDDWEYRLGKRSGINISGLNRKENVFIENDALHIKVTQETFNGVMENTGGGVLSKHQFAYSYYETLSKPFMAGRGVHSSFWQAGGTVPNNDIFEIDSYEIDWKELVGYNNLYLNIGEKNKPFPWVTRANVPFELQKDGWFLDGFEYTPGGIFFYDNGKLVARSDFKDLAAAQRILLTALNGVGKVEADKMPGESLFKYFRYYGKAYPGVNILPNASFEYNRDRIDPAMPVAWLQKDNSSKVIAAKDAVNGQYTLRQANASESFNTELFQKLEYLVNGTYTLTAKVKTSTAIKSAFFSVSDFGSRPISNSISASIQWTDIIIPNIKITNHTAVIKFGLSGLTGQNFDVDDIRFYQDLENKTAVSAPNNFNLVYDPIWTQAESQPIIFNGDKAFYFFDRNVGYGDTVSIGFDIKPALVANMCPITRSSQSGKSGWAILFTNTGDVIFRIGSIETHHDVIAPHVYKANQNIHLNFVYQKSAALIYLNGRLIAKQDGIAEDTKDAVAAGRLGATNQMFDAVGDVMARTKNNFVNPGQRFVGEMGKLRIYNRGISSVEMLKDRL